MLDSLRFVQGAVAKKDFVPALQHFRIEGGTIRGFNGMMGLSSPIDLDLDVMPKATPFVKAIQTCKDTIAIHVTPTGKLSVKSGKFKAFVDCNTEHFPEFGPEGVEIDLKGEMLSVLKKLNPFIAEDASRPWARGVLLRGQSAYATNNVCIVEHWLGYPFPVEINIPKAAVAELLRIGEEPTKLQLAETSVTFHFAGKRWLRTQTFPTNWPDIARILDQASNQLPVPPELWKALEDISPFVNVDSERVYLNATTISTSDTDADGASVEIPAMSDLNASGCYHIKQLRLLEDVAKSIDLSTYPKPCLFFGDKLRGAIVGMRS